MKRLYAKAYAALFLLVGLFSFVACEIHVGDDDGYYSDRDRAYVISGQWQGDFGMYYATPHPVTGQMLTFDADYTNIVFYPSYAGANRGYGKQVDYYGSGPYQYQYYSFNWEVRNGAIYLYYPRDPNLNVVIYDYSLNNYYFTGYLGNSRTSFRLHALRDYSLWNSFSGDYYYGIESGWSWTQAKDAPSFEDEQAENVALPQVKGTKSALSAPAAVVRGNRFLEATQQISE